VRRGKYELFVTFHVEHFFERMFHVEHFAPQQKIKRPQENLRSLLYTE